MLMTEYKQAFSHTISSPFPFLFSFFFFFACWAKCYRTRQSFSRSEGVSLLGWSSSVVRLLYLCRPRLPPTRSWHSLPCWLVSGEPGVTATLFICQWEEMRAGILLIFKVIENYSASLALMKRFDWMIYFDDPNDLALQYDGQKKWPKVHYYKKKKTSSLTLIKFQKENGLWLY